MGSPKLTPNSNPYDIPGIIRAIAKLSSKLGSGGSPTFSGLTLTGLTGILWANAGVVTGDATLDQIGNLATDKTFNNGNNSLSFNFIAPSGQPTYDGAFEIQASGAFTGDLFHVHQHTGNPGVTDLCHFEATDTNVTVLRLYHSGVAGTCLEIGPSGTPVGTIDSAANAVLNDLSLTTPSNIYALSHDAFANFVSNEHIDHSTVSVLAGTGMSGGGTINASVTLNCTITQYTDEMTQDAVGGILVDSSSINFTYTDATPEITAVVLPAGVDHDALLNFAANEHIDHTTVSISTGTGLTGGGNISANRTISLSHLGIESLTDPNADTLLGWDDTDGAAKFITIGTNLSYDHATHTLSSSGGGIDFSTALIWQTAIADGAGSFEFANVLSPRMARPIYIQPQQTSLFTSNTTGSGSVTAFFYQHVISTGATNGSTAASYVKLTAFLDPAYDYGQARLYTDMIITTAVTTCTVWLGWLDNPTAPGVNNKHAAFKIVNGTIYASVGDGAANTVVDTGLTAVEDQTYKVAILIDNGSIKFYVDGVLEANITTNLFSALSANFGVYITNSAASTRSTQLSPIFVWTL